MVDNGEIKENFSLTADNPDDPVMMTIAIPIRRCVESGADGFSQMLGKLEMYKDQLKGLYIAKMEAKMKGGVIIPSGVPVDLKVH